MKVNKLLSYYINTKSFTRPLYMYLDDGNVLCIFWNIKLDKLEYKVYPENKVPKFSVEHECFEIKYDKGEVEFVPSSLLTEMETVKPKVMRTTKEKPAPPVIEIKPRRTRKNAGS